LGSHKRHESENETWYGIKEEEDDEGKARLSTQTQGEAEKDRSQTTKSPKKTALRKIVNAAKRRRKMKKKRSDPIPAALEAARHAVRLAE